VWLPRGGIWNHDLGAGEGRARDYGYEAKIFDKVKEETHETWNVVVWHVNGGESIGYGTGLQGQGVGNGRSEFLHLDADWNKDHGMMGREQDL